MTNRVTFGPQDFQKMCKQAERDHESRKLVQLIERVKQQIAARDGRVLTMETPKLMATGLHADSTGGRLPSRSVPRER